MSIVNEAFVNLREFAATDDGLNQDRSSLNESMVELV